MATTEVINLNKSTSAPPSVKLDAEAKAALKAKVTRVLERGLLADRLTVELPDDMYGEWVYNDPVEIDRMSTMGFQIDTKYSVNSSLHGQGKVGDTIFMVASRDVKEVIDEARSELYERTHGKYNKKEESEFSGLIEKQGTPVHNSSKTHMIDGNTLKQTIEGN
jgi:hypothetical protein